MQKFLNTKVLVILIFTFLLSTDLVSATYISITTSITDVFIDNEMGRSNLTIENKGDEQAYNVHLSLLLPDCFETDEIYVGKLDPNKPLEKNVIINREKDIPAGLYPAVLIVDYKDGNMYPFSAITPFSIVYKQRTNSLIFGTIGDVTLTGKKKKKLSVALKNSDNETHNVSINLFLPRELTAKDSKKTVTIGPSSEKQIDFEISSFSALPGSTYQIFCSIAYEKNELAYSSFAKGIIKIEEEKFIFSTKILIAILAVLLIVFVSYQIWYKKWKPTR